MLADDDDVTIPERSPIHRVFFYVGYTVVACAVLVVLAELVSMLVLGFHWGSYERLSVIAPTIPYDQSDRRIFSMRNRLADDLVRASGVHAGQPWAEEFMAEASEAPYRFRHRYEPFRAWGNAEVRSKYINVDSGPTGIWRRTANVCKATSPRSLAVWVFGGSAMVGIDAPDFATIPSYLSDKLNRASGDCIEVTNMGVLGYVVNQETVLLTQLLKAGHRPDIVVFFDGANDAHVGAYSPGDATAHGDLEQFQRRIEDVVYLEGLLEKSYTLRVMNGVARRAIAPVIQTLTGQGDAAAGALSDTVLQARARQTLDNYEANLALVRALGRAYGFTSHFFWQPMLVFGSKGGTVFEEVFRDHPAFNDAEETRATIAVYQEAERRATANGTFTFLGHVFDEIRDPIYVDQVHLGSRGNEIIAGAIAASILAQPPR